MDGGSVAATLFVIFLVLKLTGNIAWSWWWVFAPIWIDVLASGLLLLLIGTGAIAGFGLLKRRDRKRTAAGSRL